jgi:hypothetical protein
VAEALLPGAQWEIESLGVCRRNVRQIYIVSVEERPKNPKTIVQGMRWREDEHSSGDWGGMH